MVRRRLLIGGVGAPWTMFRFLADKKHPSPWLTTIVLRVQARLKEPAVT